jgi:hypothetical protein
MSHTKLTICYTVLFFSFTVKIVAYEEICAKTTVSPGGIGGIVSQSSVSSTGTPLPPEEEDSTDADTDMNISSEP